MPAPPALVAHVANLMRYAMVSVVSTTVGLTTLGVLVASGWPAGWSNVLATGVGTVPSFELNRRWVWRRRGQPSLRRQVVPFVVLCAIELAVSTLAVHLAATWATGAGLRTGARTAVVLAANVLAYGSCWVGQYLILDRVLFVGES